MKIGEGGQQGETERSNLKPMLMEGEKRQRSVMWIHQHVTLQNKQANQKSIPEQP